MNKLLVLTLFLIATFGVANASKSARLSQFFDEKQINKIDKLKESQWGKLYFELAELHAFAKGPIEDLLSALQKLITDSEAGKAKEQQEFDNLELQHNRQIDYLKNQIRSAEDDVLSSTNRLNNVLFPTQKQLTESINDLKTNIANNLESQEKEKQNRKEEKAIYDATSQEYNEAIQALDQAITVVSALQNKATVLVEVTIYKHSISKLAAALRRHDKFTPWIKSLISSTEKLQSKDPESIRGCIKLLNEIRSSIVDELQEITNVENSHIASYNERMATLAADLAELKTRLESEVNNEIENNKAIQTAQAFIQQRNEDLKLFKQQVIDENTKWQQLSGLHDQFVKDIEEEISTTKETYGYLSSAEFGGYLRRKMTEAGVTETIAGPPTTTSSSSSSSDDEASSSSSATA